MPLFCFVVDQVMDSLELAGGENQATGRSVFCPLIAEIYWYNVDIALIDNKYPQIRRFVN